MRRRADKAALDELEDRRMIHRYVRDVVLAGKRRDDQIRQPEAKLCREALRGFDIGGIRAGPTGF